ncbi:phage tail protein [Stappia sp. MMSF_3263]|uniref:phage tail protein n=1 Tax=Stappia sp. MMSF_3263 TaxID=3046693 RepID=UPI00273DDDC9|nr:tail fiber protein [Stappia sp. MMSF_3263]
MSEPFVGEIRMFAGNFAPRGWAFCDGQLLAVSQNDALFSLLGTIYGGDGRTTFGLPDLRGRIPIHAGHGPGLSERRLGAKGGAEKVTLTVNQMPSHGHPPHADTNIGIESTPTDNVTATSTAVDIYFDGTADSNMRSEAITHVGGSRSHTNEMPFLCVHFIIALFGIYPSRH